MASLTIPDNFQAKYTNRWWELLQQKASRLREHVTLKTDCSGKVVFFDQFGILELDEKTERIGKTKLAEAPTYKRSLRPRFFNKAIVYDEFDGVQLADLNTPISETQSQLQAAAGRKMDDVMIEGFLGTNFIGEDGTDPIELTEVLPANYVETGSPADSNLTVPKLRAAYQVFSEREAWGQDSENLGDRLVIAVTSKQIQSLLQSVEVTSSDYNAIKALVNGEVDNFLGFKFVRTERLPKDVEGNRIALAWVKSRALLGLWANPTCKISVRDDMDEALQIRVKAGFNATRLEENGFLPILCKEPDTNTTTRVSLATVSSLQAPAVAAASTKSTAKK